MTGDFANIWALFGIEIEQYDQPNYDLVAWWVKKPSLDQLAYILKGYQLCDLTNEKIIQVVDLWRGAFVTGLRSGGVEYRLQLIPEGIEL